MASREKYTPKKQSEIKTMPFESAQEAWFWFVQAQSARNDGARFAAGQSLLPRPCEPIDIMRITDRLYRQRCLLRDHLMILRHYGLRNLAPDPRRPREAQAHTLWSEAMNRMEVVMMRKGIVRRNKWIPREIWAQSETALAEGVIAK